MLSKQPVEESRVTADHLSYIRDYLEAATESSVRSRRILVLLITASILTFTAFWNSRDTAWILTRVQWAEKLEALLRKPQVSHERLSVEESRLMERAKYYHIETLDDAKHFHEHLLDLMAEHVLYVRVPVLGVAFDINDLGVFSGITLMVLLLWCRFALWHERRNLELCREQAKPEDAEAAYRYLAMRQLLTIPPRLKDPKDARIWALLVLVLFCLPALIYAVVVGYDLLYSDFLPAAIGLYTDLIVEVLCLVVVLVLSLLCMLLLSSIHKTWNKFAEDIRNPQATSGVSRPAAEELVK
jgi:uncharacterized membrane protein